MQVHVQKAFELGVLTDGYKYNGIEAWSVLPNRIARIEKRLASRTLLTSSQLSHDKSFSGVRMPVSKVENHCINTLCDKEELELLKAIASCAKEITYSAKLSTLERELLLEMSVDPNFRFSAFAKMKGLYLSYVYKVRDRAVKKVQKALHKALIEL